MARRPQAQATKTPYAAKLRPAAADMGQIGTSGLNRMGGLLYEEWMPELQGERGRRKLREMYDNDPIIGAMMFVTEMLIRQVPWDIRPGDSTPEGRQDAIFVEDCLNDMKDSWQNTLADILTCMHYGWSYHEIVYRRRLTSLGSKYNDGRVGWENWAIRGQETLLQWEYADPADPEKLTGMTQLGPPDWEAHTIPMEKATLFRPTTRKRSPEGRSLLRNAYRSWVFAENLRTIEAIGAARDLNGVPLALVPPEILDPESDAKDKATLDHIKAVVRGVHRDEMEGIIWPMQYDDLGHPMFDFKLLSTNGTRLIDTDKIITRYEQRMAMTMVADFLMLGHDRVGSHAMMQNKSKLFMTGLEAVADMICEEANIGPIPMLLRLNGRRAINPPMMVHGDIERVDLETIGTYLKNLAGAGAVFDFGSNSDLNRYVLEQANLPAPPDPNLVEEPSLEDDTPGIGDTPTPPIQRQQIVSQSTSTSSGKSTRPVGQVQAPTKKPVSKSATKPAGRPTKKVAREEGEDA